MSTGINQPGLAAQGRPVHAGYPQPVAPGVPGPGGEYLNVAGAAVELGQGGPHPAGEGFGVEYGGEGEQSAGGVQGGGEPQQGGHLRPPAAHPGGRDGREPAQFLGYRRGHRHPGPAPVPVPASPPPPACPALSTTHPGAGGYGTPRPTVAARARGLRRAVHRRAPVVGQWWVNRPRQHWSRRVWPRRWTRCTTSSPGTGVPGTTRSTGSSRRSPCSPTPTRSRKP